MNQFITEQDIERIVELVLKNCEPVLQVKEQLEKPAQIREKPIPEIKESGVFSEVEAAIEAAYQAQKEYVRVCRIEDRKRIINAIRNSVMNKVDDMARKVYEETKIGRLEDKKAKIQLAALGTPGTENITTTAVSGDNGLTIEEMAPFGLIGAVTPVTNPVETIINNAISMLAAGNSVVFNVHPLAASCSAYAVDILNKAIAAVGGPLNLVAMVRNPTMETLDVIIRSEKVKILVGTGGPGLVKTLLSSGKKAIGAGAGNPPVIVDATADLEKAAKGIITGASFDNNILCIAEKEVFVVKEAADDLIYHMLQNDAYMLDKAELEKVMALTLAAEEKQGACGCSSQVKREFHVHKQWIGRDAEEILSGIGVAKAGVRLLICEVDFEHPYVQLEQMMPVLPIVRCNDLEEAMEMAVKAEHGNKHTASIYSRDVENITKFARRIDTTVFVKNAPTLAGVGFKGEGTTTFTIAGPTGEGITSARVFTRSRRCVLAEGGFRIM